MYILCILKSDYSIFRIAARNRSRAMSALPADATTWRLYHDATNGGWCDGTNGAWHYINEPYGPGEIQ